MRFRQDDHVLYEDDNAAVELLNGELGPTIVIYRKLGYDISIAKYPLQELLEDGEDDPNSHHHNHCKLDQDERLDGFTASSRPWIMSQ